MPIRRLNGTSDYLTFGIGGQSVAGDFTYVAFARRRANGERGIGRLLTSEGATSPGFWIAGSNNPRLQLNGGASYEVEKLTWTESDGWVIFGWASSSTSGAPTWRAHKCVVSSMTFTHEDVGTATAHAFSSVSGGSSQFGNDGVGDPADFDGAAEAWFNRKLSDAEFESLCELASIKGWLTSSPAMLRSYDQTSVTEEVKDLTGAGANQVERAGTEVVAEEPPIPYVASASARHNLALLGVGS